MDDLHSFCNPTSVVDFARYLTKNAEGEIVYNFGKHKGKTVSSEPDYARWMMESEFPEATKLILRRLIGGITP
jgi:DNA polymerase-3 subunit epsilon